jgi:polyisoprenyl-teichoic acid--peptidoglycan teichoic acid transferase
MNALNFAQHNSPKHTGFKKVVWIIAALALAYGGITAVGHVSNATVSVVNRITHGLVIRTDDSTPKMVPIEEDPEYAMPDNDKSRLDILVLGIRGKDDPVNGGLLTDTILLFSMDTKSGRASLVSIPRDLTVRITDERTEKINAAYAHYGVGGTKKLFSRILGVAIDNVIVADFEAFRSVVDTLGGITVTLDKPFSESQQWGNEFTLPAGENTLDGEQALYYARSRYSTSDFDRSRRQMQVILAIKEKATALSLTKDPIKILEVVTAAKKHIATDLNIFDLGTLKDLLAQQDNLGSIRRYQLTTENVLFETVIDGIYELLPRDNTLMPIKTFIGSILSDAPILPTPTPVLPVALP